MDTSTGRWVTIQGRRVFISRDGFSSTPAYFNARRSREKYQKHSRDKGMRKHFGKITYEQYVSNAVNLSSRTDGVEEMKLKDGRHYKYDAKTNEFLLVVKNRIITYFSPDDESAYWRRKQKEYKGLLI